MNMMTMAKMEEAIDETFKKPEISLKYLWAGAPATSALRTGFEDGFRAGVAWAQSQERPALARYMVGGLALIATERVLQIEEKGWTPEHDDQHVNFELIKAAEYYCAYDQVAFEVCHLEEYKGLIEDRFPSTWADSWKKRRGFPEPTDYDLAKAGALIAAELDRRSRERKLNGTSSAVSVLFERQVQNHLSSQATGNISQYPPATEQPEEEVADSRRCLIEPDQAWPRR